jgi:diguanylate cyclase
MELECARITSIAVTVSLGVAEWKDGEGAEALINRADKALYRAKGEGRNRVVLG